MLKGWLLAAAKTPFSGIWAALLCISCTNGRTGKRPRVQWLGLWKSGGHITQGHFWSKLGRTWKNTFSVQLLLRLHDCLPLHLFPSAGCSVVGWLWPRQNENSLARLKVQAGLRSPKGGKLRVKLMRTALHCPQIAHLNGSNSRKMVLAAPFLWQLFAFWTSEERAGKISSPSAARRECPSKTELDSSSSCACAAQTITPQAPWLPSLALLSLRWLPGCRLIVG